MKFLVLTIICVILAQNVNSMSYLPSLLNGGNTNQASPFPNLFTNIIQMLSERIEKLKQIFAKLMDMIEQVSQYEISGGQSSNQEGNNGGQASVESHAGHSYFFSTPESTLNGHIPFPVILYDRQAKVMFTENPDGSVIQEKEKRTQDGKVITTEVRRNNILKSSSVNGKPVQIPAQPTPTRAANCDTVNGQYKKNIDFKNSAIRIDQTLNPLVNIVNKRNQPIRLKLVDRITGTLYEEYYEPKTGRLLFQSINGGITCGTKPAENSGGYSPMKLFNLF